MGGKSSRPYNQYYARNTSRASSSNSSSTCLNLINNQTRRPPGPFTTIGNNYETLDEVRRGLARAGLESSNLILGIDFTKSNEWTGATCFQGKSLHYIPNTGGGDHQNVHDDDDDLNPYEQAISIIARTLSKYDEDDLIPCFGFGDATTHDQEVFSFFPDDRPCRGFEEVLSRYRQLVPHVRLAGPTSFAAIIETAVRIVDQSGGLYHILVIVADGQVTRSVDTGFGELSPQEQRTINALERASDYALSIVLVGVGDGPWDAMQQFDDNIPTRAFDNFQFVNFTEIMSRPIPMAMKEADFALSALMEIPAQHRATIALNNLGRRRGYIGRPPLPPPQLQENISFTMSSPVYSPSHLNYRYRETAFPSSTSSVTYLNIGRRCRRCLPRARGLAFCRHEQACNECGRELTCPGCQTLDTEEESDIAITI